MEQSPLTEAHSSSLTQDFFFFAFNEIPMFITIFTRAGHMYMLPVTLFQATPSYLSTLWYILILSYLYFGLTSGLFP